MNRGYVVRMTREVDCIHVNLSGDMAMATERLSRFADAIIESVAQHLETSSDRYRRDYFAAKVRELKTQAPAHPAGQDRIDRKMLEIGEAVNRACGELPAGWDLHIELENGAGGVRLYDPTQSYPAGARRVEGKRGIYSRPVERRVGRNQRSGERHKQWQRAKHDSTSRAHGRPTLLV